MAHLLVNVVEQLILEGHLTESLMSHQDLRGQLQSALRDEHTASPQPGMYYPPDVLHVFGDQEAGTLVHDGPHGQYFQRSYKITRPKGGAKVEMGKRIKVTPRVSFDKMAQTTPADAMTQECDLELDFAEIEVMEAATPQIANSANIKIIAPGWGSSGYYGADMLKRDGPKVFTKGTQMFWNHQTAAEEAARPEGDLRDLAATLEADAAWNDNGAKGPGLYAPASIKNGYQKPIAELKNDIGVSIRARGTSVDGKAAGRQGPIITSLTAAKSVDFVTRAGAGGRIVSVFEAAGRGSAATIESEETTMAMDAETKAMFEAVLAGQAATATRLTAIEAANVTMQESTRSAQARTIAESMIKASTLHDLTKARLVEASFGMNVPVDSAGRLDESKLRESITASIARESEYLKKLGAGVKVANGGDAADVTEASTKALDESAASALTSLYGADVSKSMMAQ